MSNLRLVKPALSHEEDIMTYRQEFLNQGK